MLCAGRTPFPCQTKLLGISHTLSDKLESIELRASSLNLVIFNCVWTVLKHYEPVVHAAVDVFKSFNYLGLHRNEITFERQVHGKNTRGNGSHVKLPKVRTAFGTKSFAYQGARIFNDLNKCLLD